VSADNVPSAAEWAAHKAFYDLTVLQRDAAWRDVERLQQWKAEAAVALEGWTKVWVAAGRPGPLGTPIWDSTRRVLEEREAVLDVLPRLVDAYQRAVVGNTLAVEGLLSAMMVVSAYVDSRPS
jgi:hypothetical protein